MNEIKPETSDEQRLAWRLEKRNSRAKLKAKKEQEENLEVAGLVCIDQDTVIKIETAETVYDFGEVSGIDEFGPALDMVFLIINETPNLREIIRKKCVSYVRPDNMNRSGAVSFPYDFLRDSLPEGKKNWNEHYDKEATGSDGRIK